jgi:raffinose/stachyose/melibiose transport system substrate-binding protein
MSKMRPLFKRTLIVALACMAVASYGQSKDDQKLTVWLSQDGSPKEHAAYIEDFGKANPDVKFEVTWFNSEDYKTQMRLALGAGTPPDIFYGNAGSLFDEYYAAGACSDLTSVIKSKGFDKRANAGYFGNYTKNGKIYGFPIAGITVWQNLYVNLDLFEKFGVKLPKTVPELVAASKVFSKNGIAPVAIGNKDGWPAILLLGDFFVQLSDFSLAKDINTGKTTWNNEKMKKSFTTVVELGRQGVYMPGFASQDHVAGIQTFAAGKAAMLYNGSWWTGVTGTTDLGFKLDVIALPLIAGVKEVKCVQMSSDHGMIISSKTKNMDAAVRFLDYYTNEKASILRSNEGNVFSVYPGANEKLSLDPLFLKAPIIDQFKKPVTGIFFDWAFPVPVIEVVKTRIQMAIDNKITIEKALADIQAEQDKQNKLNKQK